MSATVQHPRHAPDRQETRIADDNAGTKAGREMYRIVCACGFAGGYYWAKAEACMSWLNHATRQLDVLTLKPLTVPPIPRDEAARLIASYL